MQDILASAIGLDVHRDIIVACYLHGRVESEPKAEHRTFSTLAPGMREMLEWIESTGCRCIAMENTASTDTQYMTRLSLVSAGR